MNKTENITELKNQYQDVVRRYTELFIAKHELETYNDAYWIGGDVGTIITLCDMFISFNDIRYDIDNNVDEHLFCEWYWKTVEEAELELRTCNYESYVKGLRLYSDEEMADIRKRHAELEKMKQEFADMIKAMSNR